MSTGDPPPGIAPQLDAQYVGWRPDAPYRVGEGVWYHGGGLTQAAVVTAVAPMPTGGWGIWVTVADEAKRMVLYDTVGRPYGDEGHWLVPREPGPA